MLARGNIESVEHRRTLTLKVVISTDTVARLVLNSSGVDLATAGTNDEAVGLCAGEGGADGVELCQVKAYKTALRSAANLQRNVD